MNFGIFLAISALVLIVLGWYLGYRSAPNKEARELLRKKQEEEATKKAQEEADGRERNRVANLQEDVLSILDRVLNGSIERDMTNRFCLSGRDQLAFVKKYPAISKLLDVTANQPGRNLRDLVANHEERIGRLSELNRETRGQLRDVYKALELGQPVKLS